MKKLKLLFLLVHLTMPIILSAGTDDSIQLIFNRLFNSMNDRSSYTKPKLEIVDDRFAKEKEIASYSVDENIVRVGKSFLELTSHFGADSTNARVHVLCHELAHIFRGHGYTHVIGTSYASKNVTAETLKQKSEEEYGTAELEADQWAFFYAHIAGYQTTHVAAALLDSIYYNYGLRDEDLERYPSLEKRKSLATQAAEKMKGMLAAFDFANVCIASGEYEHAKEIYKLILHEGFKSSEIYQNMGVTYLLEFLSTLTNEEFEYEVPLLLDTKSRLHTTASRAIIISDSRSLMLEEAKEAFKNCIAIDDKNSFAAYHLSIVYYFLQMKFDRDFFATKAKEYGDSIVQRSIICCNALWNLKSESKKEVKSSIRQLDSLATLGFVPAIRNLRIYEAVEKQSKMPEEAFSNTIPNWLGAYNERPSPLVLGAGKPIFLDAFVKGSGRLTCKLMPETEGFTSIYRWKVGTSVLNQTIFKMDLPIKLTKEQKDELVASSKSIYQCSNQTICSIGNLVVCFDYNNNISQIQRIER
jgi:tetratricopeptide (TPR) repeat protein